MATAKQIESRERVAKWIAGGLVIGTGIYFGRGAYKDWKAKKDVKEHGESDCEGVNLAFKADKIYDAFWKQTFGMTEDEETAVNELSTVPKDCIPALALLYNKKYGKNLYTDFTYYVQGDLFEQIRFLIE